MVDSNKFKIKIFNKNKNEVFYSDLLDIFFTTNNPRFTIIPKSNINLINFLKHNDKTQDKILKKINKLWRWFFKFLPSY